MHYRDAPRTCTTFCVYCNVACVSIEKMWVLSECGYCHDWGGSRRRRAVSNCYEFGIQSWCTAHGVLELLSVCTFTSRVWILRKCEYCHNWGGSRWRQVVLSFALNLMRCTTHGVLVLLSTRTLMVCEYWKNVSIRKMWVLPWLGWRSVAAGTGCFKLFCVWHYISMHYARPTFTTIVSLERYVSVWYQKTYICMISKGMCGYIYVDIYMWIYICVYIYA